MHPACLVEWGSLSNGGQTPQSGERVVRELDQYQAHRLDEDFTSKCPFAEINLSANHLVRICFAKRGNKPRNTAMRSALEQAAAIFVSSFGFSHPPKNHVISSTPPNCVGLQAVDYYLWALQRFYERREDRFLELIWPQVSEIHDLDRLENKRRGVFYTKQKPLTLAAFEE